ncbi:ceramidase domain-containing protein [Acuticoccus kandeliae]|uniref:ceramidase domain-containing protein n=1 Tax=Acuticoccus kandeliae TaxID=2073160 RepID=UPI000D3E34DE|nr:ceramidase domain-containing protein [Acuticoccus kandeliae]
MNWNEAIDNYCERLGPEFWAEPWNAVTNAAFVIAAIIAIVVAHRRGRLDPAIWVLITITALVGVGSFLFHTFATRWAVMADVIPIQLFILAYFVLAVRRFAGMAWWGAGLATVGFVAFSIVGGRVLDPVLGPVLNGSEGYLPPLAALFVVGFAIRATVHKSAGTALMIAGCIFALSLTFRTVDMAVCPTFPRGTHFLWHTLNGVLLGYLMIAMARFGRLRGREGVAG